MEGDSQLDQTLQGESQFDQSLLSCICAITFIVLLSLDALNAWRRRMHWVRGDALSLCVLTMQLLTVIGNDNINDSNIEQIRQRLNILLRNDQLVIDSRRLMMCVFIGYLVPGMARFYESWLDIATLAFTVMIHMVYELRFVWKYIYGDIFSCINSRWFTVYSTALFIAITLLVVALLCSALAGMSLDNITSQKIPKALSCCPNSGEKGECNDIEDHILKCWIVARACRSDYIIARSVFSAFAGTVVTICVVMFVVKLRYVHHEISHNHLYQTTVLILLGFDLIGWIIILMRWFTAVIYFPRNKSYIKDLWRISLGGVKEENPVADFLTRQLFLENRIRERNKKENVMMKLLKAVAIFLIWLEILVVLLSKACWVLSEIVFRMIRPCIMSREKINMLQSGSNRTSKEIDHEFLKYKKALQIIRMRGEIACSMWIANESAYNQTKNHMEKGSEQAKGTSQDLIKLLAHKTGPAEDEPDTSLEEEKHVKVAGKNSSKMRAVSLIHLMIYFYDGSNCDPVNNAIEAYKQAREYMEIVEGFDWKGTLMRAAADREFDRLQSIWKEYVNMKRSIDLEEKIRKPLREYTEQLSNEETSGGKKNPSDENLHDSEYWMTEGTKISLYKKWKAMDRSSPSVIDDLQSSLANLIFHCMQMELKKALIENCMEWAHEGKEENIFKAAFTVGKAKGVLGEKRKDQVQDQV